MIGKSRAEYLFIRGCIIGLHHIAPLCLAYCALIISLYGFRTAITSPVPLAIECIAVAESLFFLFVYIPYRYYLQKDAIHPLAPGRAERRNLFNLCNDNIPDPESYLQRWFLGADPKDIKRENVKEFFLWAFFNRGGPPGDDEEELEEYVVETEKLLGRPIDDGRGKAICLRLTLDRVNMMHRSLIWYCCVGFVDFLTYINLLYSGFQFYRAPLSQFFGLFPFRPQTLFARHTSPAKHITYWYRPHTSTTKLPILFIHGLGIGLYPYIKFLRELNSTSGVETSDAADEQVGILALEIMPVSFRITHRPLTREEFCIEVNQILLQHFSPTQRFVIVSHSYGTVLTTHLLKSSVLAPRIGPIVLIDPVSILLHLPDVAYNFTRRKPKMANEHQLHYFASMDMSISHTLGRHFFWSENVLWRKEIEGREVSVCLSGRDLIVDTEAVGRYISGSPSLKISQGNGHATGKLVDIDGEGDDEDEAGVEIRDGTKGDDEEEEEEEEWKSRPWTGQGIEVLWFEDLDHAQVFDTPETRGRVIRAIRTYCEDG